MCGPFLCGNVIFIVNSDVKIATFIPFDILCVIT